MNQPVTSSRPDCLLAYVDLTTPEGLDVGGYHLGIGYLRARLEALGIHTAQLITTRPASLDDLVEEICQRDAPIVGLTCYDSNFHLVTQLARRVKRRAPGVCIVCGGPTATFSDRFILEQCQAVDLCVRGEAEDVMPEVCQAVAAKSRFEHIGSLSFRQGGVVVRTPDRPIRCQGREGELDTYPSPYLSGVIPATEGPRIGVISSRGCPYRCAYCNFATMFGHTLRWHSVDRFMAELTAIAAAVGTPRRLLHIHDDAFTHRPERMKEICRRMIASGLNRIGYTCNGRIDHLDEEALTLLHQANIRLHFGVESANPRVLRRIQKIGPDTGPWEGGKREQQFLDRIVEKTQLARRLGIHNLSTSIILGLPGEDAVAARQSVEFVRRLEIVEYAHNYLQVYPGTRFFEDRHHFGLRVLGSPYGLPHRTLCPDEILAIEPGANAAQVRIARNEREELARWLEGAVRPTSSRYPHVILIEGAPKTWPASTALFLDVTPALSTKVVLLADRWDDSERETLHTWIATRQLVLKPPTLLEGALPDMKNPSSGLRLKHLYLRGPAAVWRTCSFARLVSEGCADETPAAGTLVSIDNEADGDCLERILAARPATMLGNLCDAGSLHVLDGCRWADVPCPAHRLERLLCRDGAVRCCFYGASLGRCEDDPSQWRRSIRAKQREEEARRECQTCPARSYCSRCPFLGRLEPRAFCDLRRRLGPLEGVLALLRDLDVVLSRELSNGHGEKVRPFRLIRGRRSKVIFLQETDGRTLRYDSKKHSVAVLGSAIAQIVGLVVAGLRGRVLAQAVSKKLHRTCAEATALLLNLERRLDLPVT